MKPAFPLTLDQVDAINQHLLKCKALAHVLGNCAPGEHSVAHHPPSSGDLFLIMLIMSEELEKIWEIIQGLGGKVRKSRMGYPLVTEWDRSFIFTTYFGVKISK